MTELLESTYHYHLSKKDEPSKEETLEKLIKTVFKESDETYGYRSVTDALKVKVTRSILNVF